MATQSLPTAVLKLMLRTLDECDDNQTEAAKKLGISRQTLTSRLQIARRQGIALDPKDRKQVDENSVSFLQRQLKKLEAELKKAKDEALDHAAVKNIIVGASQKMSEVEIPTWLTDTSRQSDGIVGVPTLFVSDLHWGEVVDPSQIGGVNEYNLAIAQARLKELAQRAIHLLTILSPERKYDGIVVPLGGDMLSGNIHDELMVTNEVNVMPALLDLFEHLSGFIKLIADTFGRVFLPCVTGNHGRDTKKIYAKDRYHTSFDWLLYCFLSKAFVKDERVTFYIPNGIDAAYEIYGHRYLLTHGDRFRGGDGVIGVLGPVIRGDYKKRAMKSQIKQEYDTLILGHFHQYIHLTKLIINGTLKGFDEHAFNESYSYERAQQALWVTHRKHGITYRMPVYVDKDLHKLESGFKKPVLAWT